MLNGAFKQSLLSLTWPQTAFSIPCSENHPQTKKVLRCHITKRIATVHFTVQNMSGV